MNYKKVLASFVLAILLVGIYSLYGLNFNNAELAYTSGNLLRLHVIGNSNSLDDQIDKLLVRDLVLQQVQELFSDVKDRDEALRKLRKYKANLAFVVSQNLRNFGREHKISTDIGVKYFPATEYGNLKLPEGSYNALQVVVGEGGGKNWWCVLFPPLCFVDAVRLNDNAVKKEYRFFIWDIIKDLLKIKIKSINLDFDDTSIKEDIDSNNVL